MLETTVVLIEYDADHQEEAYKLKEITENNRLLFQIFFTGYKKISFSPNKNKSTINISSIEELKSMFKENIQKYMEMLRGQVYREGGEDIKTIFLKMLLQDMITLSKNSNIEPVTEETTHSINTIYSLLAVDYYQEQNTPNRLIEFIFDPTSEEKEKIFNWLNEQERYNLLNLLLEEQYEEILSLEELECDSFLRTNLAEVLRMSEINFFGGFIKPDEGQVMLPAISKEDLDKLCIEFFIKIDPSLKWSKFYNQLKRNNKILYDQEFPDAYSKWGCLKTKDDILMYAPLDGTIHDFMYFVHEFAHYITLFHKNDEKFIPFSLAEYPPIFFERCATAFLREKGYNEEFVSALEKERALAT